MRLRTLVPLALLAGTTLACQSETPTQPDESYQAPPSSRALAITRGQPATTGVVRGSFPHASICGIDAQVDVFSAGPSWDLLPGGQPTKVAGSFRQSSTANGKTLIVSGTGQVTREITDWLDEDTFVVIESHIGGSQLIKLADGPVLSRDAGRIVVRLVVHILDNGSAVLVAPPEFLEISGPHPEGEIQFATYCSIVTKALS